MAGDVGGGDYLYTFGFNFETAGLDQLLSAIEGFTQRAASGFGASLALPEGVSSPAATEGVVPLGTPAQVESATAGIEAGLKAYVESLRQAGDLTADQIKRIKETIDASMATMRRAGGRYAQGAEPQGVLLGPGGEPLVHPQEQARLRLIEAGRAAQTARGRSEASVQGPIEKLYPETTRVEDFKYIVDPANREELNRAIKARAEQLLREREFANLDQTEKNKQLASQRAVELQAAENVSREHLKLQLDKEVLARTAIRPEILVTTAENQLERERQQRRIREVYLAGREQVRPTARGGTTDIHEEGELRVAEERDRLAVSMAKHKLFTDRDADHIAQDTVAREQEQLAIKEHANAVRQAADAAVISRRLAFAATVPEGQIPRDQPGFAELGHTTAERQASLAADDAKLQAEINARKSIILQNDREYETHTAAAAANAERMAAAVKLSTEKYLQGDDALVANKAQAATMIAERNAQEQSMTQQSLAANEDYIRNTASAAVAREETALRVREEAHTQRLAAEQDPVRPVNFAQLQANVEVQDRLTAAQVETLRNLGLQEENAVALQVQQNISRRQLNAELEHQMLGASGTQRTDLLAVREAEIQNRLARERQERSDEARYLAGRQEVRPTPGAGPTSDIVQTAALELAREQDKTRVGLSRYNQMQETDYEELARLANAREDARLALAEYQHLLRSESDAAIRAGRISPEGMASGVQPGETYARRTGEVQALTEVDRAQVAAVKARQLQGNEDYAKALVFAAAATRRTQAEVQAETEALLEADAEYKDARGQAAASVRSRTSQENALTEELLVHDREYIKATAQATVAKQRQALEIEESARTQREQSGFDYAGAQARQNVAKQLEQAQVQIAQSKIMQNLPAGERIDLVTGGAGAAADRKILDAQINAQLQETLNASTAYKDATAKAAAEKKLLAAEIQADTIDQMEARAARQGTTAADIFAATTVKRQALEEETKLKVLQQQLRVENDKLAAGEQSLAVQRLLTQKQLQIAQREGAQQAFQQAGFGQAGTRFQRAQAQIDISRSGQLRDPREYQTLGAFFGQRALNTFGYLTSGIAFYGLFDQFKNALEEAAKVQRELTILKSTFQETDQAGKFDETKSALLDIASLTGRVGSEAVNVFRQLYGALGKDIPAALQATSQSLKFAQVTGLDPKEINDSLTAIALSFNTKDFTPFLDQAIHLEQVFGTLPEETVQFAADLAPLAKQLGFTATQLEALGAAAQAYSGKSGGGLAENFSRIFEVFTDPKKITDLLAVFGREMPESLDKMAEALATKDVEGAFEVILADLDRLDKEAPGKAKNIRDAIVNIAGGPRQAGALAAYLVDPGRNLEALQGRTGDVTGALQNRFEQVQESLTQTFDKIKRSIEELMQAILSAGLGDTLVSLGNAIEKIIGLATKFFDIFVKINDLFGGIPGQILAVIFAIKTLSTAMEAVQRLGLLDVLLGPGIAGALPGAAARPAARGLGVAGAAQVAGQMALPGMAAQTGGVRGAVTAAGGLRGVLTAEGASGVASAIGASLSRLAVPLAVAYAAIKVSDLVSAAQEVDEKAKDARSTFLQTVKSEIEKGATLDTVMKEAEKTRTEDINTTWTIDTGDFLKYLPQVGPVIGTALEHFGVTEHLPSFDFTPPGAETPQEKALKEFMKHNATFQQQELGVIMKNLTDDQRKRLASIIAGARNAPAGMDRAAFEQYLAAPGGLEKFAADFAQNPTNPFENDAVARVIDYARGNFPPEVQAGLEEVAKKMREDAEGVDLQQQKEQGTLDSDIQVATERLKAGIGTTGEVQRAFDQMIKYLKLTLKHATDPRLRDQLQLQIAQFTRQQSDAIAQAVKERESQFDSLEIAMGGEITPDLKKGRALRRAQDPTLDAKAHYDAYVEYIQIENDALEKRVQMARTAAEKLRLLQEGVVLPPEVRAGAARAAAAVSYAPFANILGVDAEKLGDVIADQAEKLGKDTNTVLKMLLLARAVVLAKTIKALREQKANLSIFDVGKAAGIDAKIAEAESGLRDIDKAVGELEARPPEPTPGVGEATTGTPEEIWNAAIEANKERATKLGLLADLSAARTRNPIDVAKANIEKARRQKEVADPDSVEFIQAMIDEQNAINALADAQADITAAFYTLAQSQTRDPLAKAKIGVDAARAALANAHGEAETMRAQAALNDAVNAVQDQQDDIVQALYSLAEVRSRDPRERARYALDAAIYMRDHAKGTAEWLKAQAQVDQAIQALQDAENEVVQALYELAQVQTTNPVLAAQYAVDAAQANINNAHDTATQIRAIAAKVTADRALRDTIYDVANSQVELLEAIANAAGDTVGAANIALTLARQKFDQVMASTPDDAAAVNRARANVIAAERASYDATLNQKQDDIQFALDMKQITKDQAIGMLQSLLAIPTNTLAQQRAIQRQIESLKGELGQDFQFNLPSILGLPTLYEARRLGQGMGAGLGGYQDNRQINIQVFANTNADPNQIAAAVADVMGPPQTFGVAGRRY